jgi:hypothetical protein
MAGKPARTLLLALVDLDPTASIACSARSARLMTADYDEAIRQASADHPADLPQAGRDHPLPLALAVRRTDCICSWIFHKLDETIRGHVSCSFLALVLKAELEERLAALDRADLT